MLFVGVFFFFFKQKTAYEMRISDWSSDVCSSDLTVAEGGSITYTASLTNAADTAMTVTLSNGAVINIAAGASSGTAVVAAPTDDAYIDADSVSATISSSTGGNFENRITTGAAASTSISDTLDRDRKSTRLNSSHQCA